MMTSVSNFWGSYQKYENYVNIGRRSNNRAILELLRDKKVTPELRECLIINDKQTLEDCVEGILSVIKK